MAETKIRTNEKRLEQYRKTKYKAYWSNPEASRMRVIVDYYRKKKAEGKDWVPKEWSKIYVYCKERDLDVVKVIEGTESIT